MKDALVGVKPDTSALKLTKERVWSVQREEWREKGCPLTEGGRQTGAGKGGRKQRVGGCGEEQAGGGRETVTLLCREVKG